MADKLSPEVTLQLDKERHLKFGLRALRAIKQEMKVIPADASGADPDQLAVLLWACLLHEDKTLTQDDVIDLMDRYYTLSEMRAKVTEAITLAMPEPTEAPLDKTATAVTGS